MRAVRRRPRIGLAFFIAGAAVVSVAACARGTEPLSAPEPVPLVIPPMPSVAHSASSAPSAVHDPAEDNVRGGPSIAARDPRWEARRPRSRALMLTEVQGLERLVAQKPIGAVDRGPLLRRVAETYIELARTADGTARTEARRKAIDAYEAILKDHQSNYGSIDEVRYYLGLEYELAGDPFKARSTYYDLIKTDPRSKFVPFAYFAFGEMFFAEAATDPTKNDLAMQAYAEVIKYPPPANSLFPEALLRLAETHERSGNGVKAKSFLDQLLHDFPDSDAARRAKRP